MNPEDVCVKCWMDWDKHKDNDLIKVNSEGGYGQPESWMCLKCIAQDSFPDGIENSRYVEVCGVKPSEIVYWKNK